MLFTNLVNLFIYMKTKIEIKNRFTGSIIFEFECDGNTVLKTIQEALKNRADLREADLRGADLRGANLRGADLREAENKDLAYIPIHCKWSTSIKGDLIQIGCKEKTIEEWNLFFSSDEEYTTKRGTDDFKQIQAVYLAYKAYLEFLKS